MKEAMDLLEVRHTYIPLVLVLYPRPIDVIISNHTVEVKKISITHTTPPTVDQAADLIFPRNIPPSCTYTSYLKYSEFVDFCWGGVI